MTPNKTENIMTQPRMEKVVLSCGATGPDLDRATRLLEMLSNMKAEIIKAGPKRRTPAFSVKPNLPLGTRVTLRGKKAQELLKRLLGAIDISISKKQIATNGFSFGI